jgi:hypothetical protein
MHGGVVADRWCCGGAGRSPAGVVADGRCCSSGVG